MMKVDAVILEMQGIGLKGFPRQTETAAETLDVIKKEIKRTPKASVDPLNESQDKRHDAVTQMSELYEKYSKIAGNIRDQLQEADTILKDMDAAAAEYRRNCNE